MTITSHDNAKLKLVRKLRERKHREREDLFATEGEDLLAAGLAAGAGPRFVLVAAGASLEGAGFCGAELAAGTAEEVEPELLAGASTLGSGTRAIAVWPRRFAAAPTAPSLYLHGVGDPGNVGAILRSADALLGGAVVLGPECADPFSPKAVRASMGSIFTRPPLRAELGETAAPRVALVAHGGGGLEALAGAATVCLGAEREGLPDDVVAACDAAAMIPLRPGGAESLNVAAAAAIACQRMSEAAR
ncbi:MAG TPA: RNA methyltransferase [Solirubrobacterales bacterium]|jgi:TrmH family RNA methyltransferase